METINKKFLQQQLLAQNEKLTPEQAFYLVRDFFSIISEALEQGEEVKIHGFGSFKLRDKKSRPGRDILKGRTVQISARRVVTFSPAKRLMDEMRENNEHLKRVLVDSKSGANAKSAQAD